MLLCLLTVSFELLGVLDGLQHIIGGSWVDLKIHRRGKTQLTGLALFHLAAGVEGAGTRLVRGEHAAGIPDMGTLGGEPREPGNGLSSGGHEGRTLLLDKLRTIP